MAICKQKVTHIRAQLLSISIFLIMSFAQASSTCDTYFAPSQKNITRTTYLQVLKNAWVSTKDWAASLKTYNEFRRLRRRIQYHRVNLRDFISISPDQQVELSLTNFGKYENYESPESFKKWSSKQFEAYFKGIISRAEKFNQVTLERFLKDYEDKNLSVNPNAEQVQILVRRALELEVDLKKIQQLIPVTALEIRNSALEVADRGRMTLTYLLKVLGPQIEVALIKKSIPISIQKNTNGLFFKFDLLSRLLTAEELLPIAEAIARNYNDTKNFLSADQLKIFSETQRMEIARSNLGLFSNSVQRYDIHNIEARFKLLEEYPPNSYSPVIAGGNAIGVPSIKDFEFPEHYHYRIAKEILVPKRQFEFASIFSTLKLTQEQQFEVASGLLKENRSAVLKKSIRLFDQLSPQQRFELAKASYKLSFSDFVHIKNFKLSEVQYIQLFRLFKDNDLDETIRVARMILSDGAFSRFFGYYKPWAIIEKEVIRDHLSTHHFDKKLSEVQSISELKSLLISYVWRREDIPKILEIAFDKIQRREVGLELISIILRYRARNGSLPKNSLDAISNLSGIPYEILQKAKLSENSLGNLYELLIEIQRDLHGPLFKGIEIESSVIRKTEAFLGFLNVIRNVQALSENKRQVSQRLHQVLKENRVTVETLEAVTQIFKDFFSIELKKMFQKQNLKITYEDFFKLKSEWGDLEPIWTLLARFNKETDWKALVPELGLLFSHVLNGNFESYKFNGDPASPQDVELAKAQLSMLNFIQKAAWMQSRVQVRKMNANLKGLTDQQIANQIHEIVTDNLLPHIKFHADKIQNSGRFADIVSQEKKNPNEILESLLKESFPEGLVEAPQKIKFIFYSLAKEISKTSNLLTLKNLSSFMEFLVRTQPELIELSMKEQVQMDLKSIKEAANGAIKTSAGQRSILLTALNHDPKFLLTIGDKVKAASCQHYKYGGYIHTLLGYVIDANVKAMVSFELAPEQFKNYEDFSRVYEELDSGKLVTRFDGNKMQAVFKLADGSLVESLPIEYGYLRRIVKVGTSVDSKKANLYLERDYIQNHRALEQMREMQDDLIGEVAQEMSAGIGGATKVEKSRNIFGHYSDAAGGVRTDSYVTPGK